MKDPENIRGVLPPSFRAWYQLLNKVKGQLEKSPDLKTIVWFELHPAGLRQGYEFTLDEIKARALDEFIVQAQAIVDQASDSVVPDHFQDNVVGKFYDVYSLVKVRFLKPQ